MTASLKSIGAITLFVDDPQRAKSFYENVFGVPTIYEDDNSAVVQFDNTIVNLLAAREAPGLIAPVVVADGDAGSRMQFTIWVDDIDAVCADLATRDVRLLNGPIDRPWSVRTALFADPDGHLWEVAQQLARAAT